MNEKVTAEIIKEVKKWKKEYERVLKITESTYIKEVMLIRIDMVDSFVELLDGTLEKKIKKESERR